MLSNGGVATVYTARRFPVQLLESGPAGGALGAVAYGRRAGRPDQLTFDMGGTTAKLCIVEDGEPLVTHAFEADRVYRLRSGSGLPVRAPVIDMIEIGAGGGSIAHVDPLGLITVGPDSAGSDPGPVSYGRGGERCTVTDADVVLGYLHPERFLGGRMRLDAEAASEAIRTQVAEPMGIGVAEAAWGIHATVNENMANAARVHAIERGQDPAGLPMFVMGGNGPLHGPGVAAALGCRSVVAPPAAGVLSAVGFLSAALSIDLVRSWHARLDQVDEAAATEAFAGMQEQAVRVLAGSGVAERSVVHAHSLDMRFVGQGSEIEVPVPPVGPGWADAVRRSFAEQYERLFGKVSPQGLEVEILSWRLKSRGPEPALALSPLVDEQAADPLVGHRPAYFPDAGGYVATAVYDRYRLTPGTRLEGPALVQERESTLVLAPGMRCLVADDGSVVVELDGGAG
jgi:N-methylhydantoinase A